MTYKPPVGWAVAIFACSPTAKAGVRAASAIRSAMTKESANRGASERSWPVAWPAELANPLNDWMGGMRHHSGSTVGLSRSDTPDGREWGWKAGNRMGEILLEYDPASLFLVMAWCPYESNYSKRKIYMPGCKIVAGGTIHEHTSGLVEDLKSSSVDRKVHGAWRSPAMIEHLARSRLASAAHRVPALLQWRAQTMASQWPQPVEETQAVVSARKPRF